MRVFVECYPDTAVMQALGVSRKQLRHERCKGEVVKKVLKLGDAIGLIDEDPNSGQPRDLASYELVQASAGLRLLVRRNDANRKLIMVCPRLEDWMIQRAKATGIQPEDYDLPRDPDRLHSIPHYEQRQGFRRFLDELMQRDADGMGLLGQWIEATT